MWSKRLRKYADTWMPTIEGYLTMDVVRIGLPAIQSFHDKIGLQGDIGEIGIHHGRTFLALESLRSEEERAVAVDVFDRQELNIDKSGKGSRAAFLENISKAARNETAIHIHEEDSLSIHLRDKFDENGYRFRVFSVDGGHTVHHAMNDLLLAEKHLLPGGVILLDDFCHPGFPGVTEAVYRYIAMSGTLVPVATISTKLLFISMSYAAQFRAMLVEIAKPDKRILRNTRVGPHEVLWLVPRG